MSKYYSRRNLDFLLYEAHKINEISELDLFKKHNKDVFDMILDAAGQLADKEMYPFLEEMDRQEPQLVDGHVKVNPQIRKLMKEFGNGGWISADAPEQFGGQELPLMITSCAQFIFGASNYSASVYPFLSAGAARLIENFATEELKNHFVPKMYDGSWQGTMAMTEPNAGSSLTDITTSANPIDDEQTIFSIKGQKIFISAGDHDGVDNVVHLMLARIIGAPAGVKGISLFIVPQKRFNKENVATENDVTTSGLFHKMGYKGAPIVQLSMGENNNCVGYLLGEKNKGLSYMFQMMNEARISVGLGATSLAYTGYLHSLAYAKERKQGRALDQKDPASAMIPIIEHSDVKRMLLQQKSYAEGGLVLCLYCAKIIDKKIIANQSGDKETLKQQTLLLDILTPIAKSWPSEFGLRANEQAIQVYGGYGYTRDYPVERFYRDNRLNHIHEGTKGIQGLDLLGRKITQHEGASAKLLVNEIMNTIALAKQIESIMPCANDLEHHLNSLLKTTGMMQSQIPNKGISAYLANATLYLDAFGHVVVAWMWLRQTITATMKLPDAVNEDDKNFYQGKINTCRYFMTYELPNIKAPLALMSQTDTQCMDFCVEGF